MSVQCWYTIISVDSKTAFNLSMNNKKSIKTNSCTRYYIFKDINKQVKPIANKSKNSLLHESLYMMLHAGQYLKIQNPLTDIVEVHTHIQITLHITSKIKHRPIMV